MHGYKICDIIINSCRFFIQWIRVNNIFTSIFGIIATILALLIMSDWQALLNDTCLEFSLYHNPHFGSSTAGHLIPTQHCWSTKNWSTAQPNYHITGIDRGHLEVVFMPKRDTQKRRLLCDVYQTGVSCDACRMANETYEATLLIHTGGQYLCLETTAATTVEYVQHSYDASEATIKCHSRSNESCDIVCLHLYSNNSQSAILQDYDAATIETSYKSLLEDIYTQSLTVVDSSLYAQAMEQCEAHTKEHCHWIPNSVITKQHCGDCQPICRSTRYSLNFIQFSLGAFWFMFSMPVAEVSLPLVISDSIREEFQVCAQQTDTEKL